MSDTLSFSEWLGTPQHRKDVLDGVRSHKAQRAAILLAGAA